MGDRCQIILEKEEYSPGETINGRVECYFAVETKLEGVRAKVIGEGKVSWKANRYSYRRAEEKYLEMDSDLLSGETTLPSGLYVYPFTFTLPTGLPSSMVEGDPSYLRGMAAFVVPIAPIEVYYGTIQYMVRVTVVRSGSADCETEKLFKISSSYDLNAIGGLQKPVEVSKEVRPAGLFKESGPITIHVRLPMAGYIPSQVVSFSVTLKNGSNVDVQYLQFRFVQGYVFHAEQDTKSVDSVIGEEFVIKDSSVEAGNERAWNLALKVPTIFLGNSIKSNVVKIFWELRGEVSLPFPHYNFSIHVPITLGSVPLAGTM